jgi:hypothetical protein
VTRIIRGPALAGLFIAAALTAASLTTGQAQAGPDEDEVGRMHYQAVFAKGEERDAAVRALAARGNLDAVPTLLLGMRIQYRGMPSYQEAFRALTGQAIGGWFEGALWLEAHPDVLAHPSYRLVKLEAYERIDPEFRRFLDGERSEPENMRIRIGEIYWGGVPVDGIPPLDNPTMVAPSEADYLVDEDLVFGLEIDGDARAYPLRVLGWHEMMNDVVGGVSVALAYCTLCGSGILYETAVEGRTAPFVFSSTGLLYRSNKLMYDRETDSVWNQFTGEPVMGSLVDSGIRLKIRPLAITSWAKWRARHPETTVVSIDTGHRRDYGSGVVYRDYFASPALMFPALVQDEIRLRAKDYVFALRDFAVAKAWPLDLFEGGKVINDTLGDKSVVLIGDAESRTVRAYARGGRRFEGDAGATSLTAGSESWQVEEAYLLGPDGTKLPRLPGHIAYWFAWENFLGAHAPLSETVGG